MDKSIDEYGGSPKAVRDLANVACEVLTYLLARRHSAESNALALRLDAALTYVVHDKHGSASRASKIAGRKGDTNAR